MIEYEVAELVDGIYIYICTLMTQLRNRVYCLPSVVDSFCCLAEK